MRQQANDMDLEPKEETLPKEVSDQLDKIADEEIKITHALKHGDFIARALEVVSREQLEVYWETMRIPVASAPKQTYRVPVSFRTPGQAWAVIEAANEIQAESQMDLHWYEHLEDHDISYEEEDLEFIGDLELAS
jgi:hypothetical protein